MRVLAVIPARIGSTRFPGKVLHKILDRPLLEWVVMRTRAVVGIDEILVATDDHAVMSLAQRLDVNCVMTVGTHQSGSDRIFEAIQGREAEIVVNVQGDEPLFDQAAVTRAIDLVKMRKWRVATLASRFKNLDDIEDRNQVKVLITSNGDAQIFTRFPLPHSRLRPKSISEIIPLKHIGIYVYEREALELFHSMPVHPWESAESLEQLRLLANGISIGVCEAEKPSVGVDSPEDCEKIIEELRLWQSREKRFL